MTLENENCTYIAAGDEMARLMSERHPNRKTIPFCEDDCCKANLEFLIGYLKGRGYTKPLIVNIVDEYSLDLLNEYYAL